MTPSHSFMGPYRILKPLAVGGQAEIFLAELSGPGGYRGLRVLKVSRDALQNREPHVVPHIQELLAEGRILELLQSPHTPRVHDLQIFKDRLVLVLEYIPGTSLSRLLEQTPQRRLPPTHALWITRSIAQALRATHNLVGEDGHPLNMIHRDVTPQNILLSTRGTCKLIDFGIATSRIAPRHTRIGFIKGKPEYLSPEQAYGIAEIDRRSDLYALGLVLYHMVTGVSPLQGNPSEALAKARQPSFVAPSRLNHALPDAFDDLLSRALARQPEQRFQSARDMEKACQKLHQHIDPEHEEEHLAAFLRTTIPHLIDQKTNTSGTRLLQSPVEDQTKTRAPKTSNTHHKRHQNLPEIRDTPMFSSLSILDLHNEDDAPTLITEEKEEEESAENLDLGELLQAIEDIYEKHPCPATSAPTTKN